MSIPQFVKPELLTFLRLDRTEWTRNALADVEDGLAAIADEKIMYPRKPSALQRVQVPKVTWIGICHGGTGTMFLRRPSLRWRYKLWCYE